MSGHQGKNQRGDSLIPLERNESERNAQESGSKKLELFFGQETEAKPSRGS